MIQHAKKAVLVGLLLIGASSSAFGLTVPQVRDLLFELDAAAQQKNAARMGQLLSDDFTITVEVPTPGGKVRMEFSKAQYLDIMIHGWNTFGQDYHYARGSVDIATHANRAQATSVVSEEGNVNGRAIISRTLEVTNFGVENGELKIINAFGYLYAEGDPVPKASL